MWRVALISEDLAYHLQGR